MILILVSIVVAGIIGFALMSFADKDMGVFGFFGGAIGFLLTVAAGIASLVYAYAAWSWFAAPHKAEIINREYSAEYTREEIFWASDVIDTVRELDRKRMEINGDLMRDDPDDR